MPQGISRKRLGLSALVIISIIGFGLLFISRFNATKITPATNTIKGAVNTDLTARETVTDKLELPQTELIDISPSEKVKSAEQAMPDKRAPAYRGACQNMKQMYVSEYTTKLQTESSRFVDAQQTIINLFNRVGRSFSTDEKSAQSSEATRHEGIVKQINGQYQTQIKNLAC